MGSRHQLHQADVLWKVVDITILKAHLYVVLRTDDSNLPLAIQPHQILNAVFTVGVSAGGKEPREV